jgi:formate hydrogenlyase subunit 4
MKLPFIIAGAFANVLLVLLLAPLFEGILRKLTARLQSRQGPPLRQPFFDLLKLLGKEDLEAGEMPFVQRAVTYLGLAAVLTTACLLPLGFGSPLNAAGDVILLIYLLTFCSVCTLLAGLASGSTFSILGSSREVMCLVTLEPILAVALLIGAIHGGSFQLNSVLNGSVYAGATIPWSGLIMLVVLILSMQAFLQRLPFDIPSAETEIMDGALMEYSGPKLALLKYSQMAKLVLYCGLFVQLFLPWGGELAFPLGWLLFWLKVVGVVLVVTVIAATHARYRIDQAIRYFAGLLLVALIALVLASYGY